MLRCRAAPRGSARRTNASRARRSGIPILAGVLPLVSARHATFLHNEVPGVEIPEADRERMAAAGEDPARAWRDGPRDGGRARAQSSRGEGVAGVYVMPQFGRYDRAAETIETVRAALA